jgi:signal transduction histidine kinase/DNA-binding response OmpR family regulator
MEPGGSAMTLRLSLRAKLVAIVGTATSALLVLLGASTAISQREERALAGIQERHLPKLQLGPRLDGDLQRLRRGLQAAVAARDLGAVDATGPLESRFLDELDAAGAAVTPGQAAALRSAMNDYYAAAVDVAHRLIAGEVGESLDDAMAAMQAKQARAGDLLQTVTAFNPAELATAFSAARGAEVTGGRIRLLVSLACLLGVFLLSGWIGRGIVRSLAEVAVGLQRFGSGDFSRPIPITSGDEMADLARRANRMAESLQRLGQERDRNDQVREQHNVALEEARRRLEHKATELTNVSAYKSQFLANMSHELRTPLNSMLLLSSLLAENEGRNLTARQVEFATTVHTSGKNLLVLIDQVLDLAKIEAGKQEVRRGPVALGEIVAHARRTFGPLAADKGLRFTIKVEPGLPDLLSTDGQRVQQILNNLLGNAIKFTPAGQVALRIGRPDAKARFHRADLRAERTIAFSVSDTGVGVEIQHQQRIFAPFEQVDGSIDRRHGGTGLGLSISRELSILLGGELQLASKLGQGSTFVCYLPFEAPRSEATRREATEPAAPAASGDLQAAAAQAPAPLAVARRARGARARESSLLVVEADRGVAEALAGIIRGQGLECLTAPDGRTGVELASVRRPAGIVVDLQLPDVDGWVVKAALRAHPATSRIPVHVVSAPPRLDEVRLFAQRLKQGLAPKRPALSRLHPADLNLTGRRILIADPDMRTSYTLSATLRAKGVEVLVAGTGQEAQELLDQRPEVDAVLMDALLLTPDRQGGGAVQRIRQDPRFRALPIVALLAETRSRSPHPVPESGIDERLGKPVDADKLLAVLHGFFSKDPRGAGVASA